MTALPATSTLPSARALDATAAAIAAAQHPSGAIPWETRGDTAGKVDPWDHIECAVALELRGLHDEADAAIDWLAATQRRDGTWPIEWRIGEGTEIDAAPTVIDAGFDTNMTAYVAVGVWHHWWVRRDLARVRAWWPMVRDALDAVCAQQLTSGAIAWAVGDGGPARHGLLAGSSCIVLALRCGLRLADLVGEARPHWRDVASTLAQTVLTRPDDPSVFAPKRRFSMDWYYPVLGGVMLDRVGSARIDARWSDFVRPGLGVLCVDDHSWVTGAETCELAIALTRLGRREEAAQLLADVQHLRTDGGAYWTGYVYPDEAFWPIERSTWTGAAVILAMWALRP